MNYLCPNKDISTYGFWTLLCSNFKVYIRFYIDFIVLNLIFFIHYPWQVGCLAVELVVGGLISHSCLPGEQLVGVVLGKLLWSNLGF